MERKEDGSFLVEFSLRFSYRCLTATGGRVILYAKISGERRENKIFSFEETSFSRKLNLETCQIQSVPG